MTMSQSRASGAPIAITLGGIRRSLRRLSRRDFGALMGMCPVKDEDRAFLTPFQIHRWAGTVDGAVAVIAIASLPRDYSPEQLDERMAEVAAEDGAWGSLTQQSTVAALVTAESLLTGEEPAATSEDEQGADPTSTGATTSTKPG